LRRNLSGDGAVCPSECLGGSRAAALKPATQSPRSKPTCDEIGRDRVYRGHPRIRGLLSGVTAQWLFDLRCYLDTREAQHDTGPLSPEKARWSHTHFKRRTLSATSSPWARSLCAPLLDLRSKTSRTTRSRTPEGQASTPWTAAHDEELSPTAHLADTARARHVLPDQACGYFAGLNPASC
jgi:hypothetical protein